jgi:hypothetical protein
MLAWLTHTYFYSFTKRRPLQITFIAIELNQ